MISATAWPLLRPGGRLSHAAKPVTSSWHAATSQLKMILKPTPRGLHHAAPVTARTVMSIPQNSESRGDETVTLKIPRTRVMFIETADGTSPTGNPIGFNLTGIENIDTMNPLRGVIRTKCDLGHWHPESEITLLPWPSQ